MSIGNRAGVAALWLVMLMVLYVGGVGAVTLLCSDGVRYDNRDITDLIDHSDEVQRLVMDPQFRVDGVLRLDITSDQFEIVSNFASGIHPYTIGWALGWIQRVRRRGYLLEQLMEIAAYIKIRALTVSIAWYSRNDEYYGAASSDDYWVSIRQRERHYHFVAGIARLHRLADRSRQVKMLVQESCRVLVVRGTVDHINAVPFHECANVLEYAAGHGEEFIVEVLLDLPGVGVNAHIGDSTRTLLHYAAMNGHLGVVNLLVGWPGIIADLQDAHLWTPLHYAVQYEHAAIVDALLDAKVNRSVSIDLNKRDWNGLTPYTLAYNTGQASVKEALGRWGGQF